MAEATATTTTTINPYLTGNFAPVREEVTVTELEVTGRLPAHLDGRYIRIGPNPVEDPDPAKYHWFTGSGMVHGVRLRDGRAEWYRNRYVRSADVANALGEEPRPGPVHAEMDFAANTHVIGHAGRTFAIVEAGARPYELTYDLDTVGPCDFDGTLPGGYTAHPKVDPDTAELHAMAYFWGWGNKVQYIVIDPEAKVRRTVDVEVTGSPMMHDFSLTQSHVIIYDLPVVLDPNKVAAGKSLPYGWNPDYPARVGVMRRDSDGSDVRWFDVEPCYVFHPMNAYDDGDRVVLDLVRHPKMFATDEYGPVEGPPTLDRWTVDLAAGKLTEERFDDRAQEFPRLDERLATKPYRYGYSAGLDAGGLARTELAFGTFFKHDLEKGVTLRRTFDPGQAVGEMVFVPNSPDAAEDDGVLMGYVYNAVEGRSDLVMLDAQSLETVASVHLPVRVPHGFHGSWVTN